MTPDERKMLTDLAEKVAKTPPPPNDPEAEEFIRTRIGRRPDALYLMTQTVLIQNLALQQAQEQIQQLQQRASGQASSSGSFLGQQPTSSPSYAQPTPLTGPYAGPAPQPQYAGASTPAPSPGSAPSFLRGAAQTAAGVAAGALAFEGIRSLFSHPGYGMGGGFGESGFAGGAPVDETIVNNYYDRPPDDSDLQLRDNRDNLAGVSNVDDSGQYEDAGFADDSSDFDGGDDSGDNFL